MAAEGPSSKKRKVLQPTIKCFMNSKQSGAGESETTPEGKPMMGRSRASARTKTNGVLKDQPPINLFMSSDKKGKPAQNENVDASEDPSPSEEVPKAPSSTSPEKKGPMPEVSSSQSGSTQPEASKADLAGKLDIKLSPEIIIFMKSVCLRQQNSRIQADMTLLQMMMDFNPQLRESDKPLVWIRMQRSLTQMAVKVKEEMDELHRQRVAAHAQAQAQAHAQAQLRAQQEAAYAAQVQAQQRAAFAAANAQRQHFAEQLKRQQADMARQRTQMARNRELQEQNYNKQLYNAVHRASSLTNIQPEPEANNRVSPQPQQAMSDEQWDNLRQSILQQISLNDKEAATLVKFIYKNFPPKGKIRINDEAIAQIPQLQRKFDPDSKKKLKMILLKVIQDYHPDKVNEEHGEKWKTVSEDIVKRVTKYYENLK